MFLPHRISSASQMFSGPHFGGASKSWRWLVSQPGELSVRCHAVSVLCADGKWSWAEYEVEFDPHCRRVLKARMKEGNLPNVPIQEKVQEYEPSRSVTSECEAVAAGFPCQAESIHFFCLSKVLSDLNVDQHN